MENLANILGADCYSPHKVEPTHPDFGFYGIHGVETSIHNYGNRL